ncbi:glucosidase 2 subunit beta [Galendromus occidentalis]|uniref:Glucosidase 2 subunit beta n=1 Tax=Galendromus occidentalis TaxID=34638 RepID=A0AAJ6VY35_9ACAR|nr:glucosidase 2 subunit beta [Galendromus occidentalis]
MMFHEKIILLVVFACITSVHATGKDRGRRISRVRGIPLQMKPFYNPLQDFVCLDGSKKMPFSRVNDDYCDCRDGSDEPGTSACPNANFYCVNLSYTPLTIPSSRVNDGICDCCDGGDEFDSKADCPNTCEELGRSYREEAKRRVKILNRGKILRQNLAQDGKRKIALAKLQIAELKVKVREARKDEEEKAAFRKLSDEKERKLLDDQAKVAKALNKRRETEAGQNKEGERRQAEEVFLDLDTNEDDFVTFEELTNNSVLDKDKDGKVSEDESRSFLPFRGGVDSEEFIGSVWPLMKPLWLARNDSPSGTGAAVPNVEGSPSDSGSVDQATPLPAVLVEHDPEVDAAVLTAERARSEHNEAEQKREELEQELAHLEELLAGDFGVDSEFVSLHGECFELRDREYIYKMCPFDKSSQRSRIDGIETSLGRWASWEARGEIKHAGMKFIGGAECWKGPARSVLVVLECGLTNELISASEPSRCEYMFEFATPAACVAGMPLVPQRSKTGRGHDEL